MNIPMSGRHDFLVSLTISNGYSPTTFPLDLFPKFKSLDLSRCSKLQMISQWHAHSPLENLTISECPQFESLPECIHILLPSLRKLQIKDCPKVESFPEGGLPSNLKEMDLNNCSKLITSLKGALGDNPSLKTLSIRKVDAFPGKGLLPLSLTSPEIRDCPNVKNLDYQAPMLTRGRSAQIHFIFSDDWLLLLDQAALPDTTGERLEKDCSH